ncbi:MAG: sensor histidine kinase, partial [Ignavibacteriaceae bacterium]|nr:sensor histidine kinase [Ignavibacteriaceae bacterium]
DIIDKYNNEIKNTWMKQSDSTGRIYIKIGDVYFMSGFYSKAIESYFKALDVYEKINYYEKTGLVKLRLARAYYFSDLKPENNYYLEAAEIFKSSQKKEYMALYYFIKGLLETDFTQKNSYLDKAIELQTQVVNQNLENIDFKIYLASFFNAKGDYENAIKIAETIDDKWFLVLFLNNYGFKLVKNKDYDNALSIFKRSLEICLLERYRTLLRNVYENISRVYRLKGNWERATYYMQLMQYVNEFLYESSYSAQIADMEIKYTTEQKSLENEYLKKEKIAFNEKIKVQRYLNFALLFSIGTITLVLATFYFGNKKLKTVNAELDKKNLEILTKQNELSKLNAVLTTNEKNLKDAQEIAQIANWEFFITTKELNFSEQFPVIFDCESSKINENGFEAVLTKTTDKNTYSDVSGFLGLNGVLDETAVIEFTVKTQKKLKWIKMKKIILNDDNGNPIKLSGTVQDITESKEEEENRIKIARQQSFAKELIKYQEDERKRIAGEIHDGLGQDLLLIKNRALLALQNNNADQFSYTQLTEINNAVSTVIDSIREISFNLRPAHLERLGLSDVIIYTIDRLKNVSSINFSHDLVNVEDLVNQENIISIFRIVQESLNNIIKHSNATEVYIGIKHENEVIKIEIKDNGRGFAFEKTIKSTKGFGLKNIINRIEILKGSFTCISDNKNGTTFTITIPVQK